MAVVVIGVVALRGLLESQGAPLDVWRQVAVSRGGVYLDHPERPAVEVDVGEARVRLEGNLGRAGTEDSVMTCRARYLVPLGPVFRVAADFVSSAIGSPQWKKKLTSHTVG